MYSGTADEHYLERCTCRCAFAGNVIRHNIVCMCVCMYELHCRINIVDIDTSRQLRSLQCISAVRMLCCENAAECESTNPASTPMFTKHRQQHQQSTAAASVPADPRLDSHQFCTSHFSYFSSSYCAPPVAMAAAAPRLTRSHALTPKGRTRRRRGCRPPPSFQAPARPRGALCPYTQVPTCPMLSTQLEGFMRLQLSFAAIANIFAPRLKLSRKSTPQYRLQHPEEVRGLLLSQTACSRHLRPSCAHDVLIMIVCTITHIPMYVCSRVVCSASVI
jgi:hypothetical protein